MNGEQNHILIDVCVISLLLDEVYNRIGYYFSDYSKAPLRRRICRIMGKEKLNYPQPNIDVSMISDAYVYKSILLGILLTGANNDGAKGMKAIQDTGGCTIVQNPDSTEVDVMPRAAIKLMDSDAIINLNQLVSALIITYFTICVL